MAMQGCRARLCAWGRQPRAPCSEDASPVGYVRRRGRGLRSDAGEAVAWAEDEAEGLPDGNVMLGRQRVVKGGE